MVDLLVSEIHIQSKIKNYSVEFSADINQVLTQVLNPGDVLIIDKNIIEIYPDLFSSLHNRILPVSANENEKSYRGIIPLINELIISGLKKNNKLIAVGGGITQDITAFISSILYRGIEWYFLPTTLLAQADSCIGSKTSINFEGFKNQIGGFYPPNKIFIHNKFLRSLPLKDIKSGLGEMSHYFVIGGEKIFSKFRGIVKNDISCLNEITSLIMDSLLIKKKYIELDEFDQKERRIFNYGHSFGHAIESITDYAIPHGIAVSFGIDIANYVSVKKGFLKPKTRNHIRSTLKYIWSNYSIKDINVSELVNALKKDKKNINKDLRLILCRDFGDVFIYTQKPDSQFIKWLNEYFKTEQ